MKKRYPDGIEKEVYPNVSFLHKLCCPWATVMGHDADWATTMNAVVCGCIYTLLFWVPKKRSDLQSTNNAI